jgi:Mg2+ and Co2+ transporter CorA
MSEMRDIDRRVAVLEQIARDTATALQDIRAELRQIRSEMQQMRTEYRSEIQELRREFRWLLRLMIGGFVGTWALMGHGLHWF